MIEIRITDNRIVLPLKVTPKGGQDAILPFQADDTTVRVKVKAPPEDGKANAAVIALLAKSLDVPKSDVEILRGETGRLKHVAVRGTPEALLGRLANRMQLNAADHFHLVF